jgi:hypothetical protein
MLTEDSVNCFGEDSKHIRNCCDRERDSLSREDDKKYHSVETEEKRRKRLTLIIKHLLNAISGDAGFTSHESTTSTTTLRYHHRVSSSNPNPEALVRNEQKSVERKSEEEEVSLEGEESVAQQ